MKLERSKLGQYHKRLNQTRTSNVVKKLPKTEKSTSLIIRVSLRNVVAGEWCRVTGDGEEANKRNI